MSALRTLGFTPSAAAVENLIAHGADNPITAEEDELSPHE
jgi:hypothetical protein